MTDVLCYIIYDTCLTLQIYIHLSHMSYAIYYMKPVLCYIFMIPIHWVSVQHITTA